MEQPVDPKAARRVIIVGRFALVWALAIVIRLAQLQIVKHDEYIRLAQMQQRHRLEIPADRGEILDRTGAPLAVSIRTESVVVNPQRVKNPEFFASVVAPAVGLDSKELTAKLLEHQDRGAAKAASRGFLRIKRHLSADEKDRLRLMRGVFPIEIVPDSRREYPGGVIGAHILGGLDLEGNGNSGIEQKLNKELKGKPGKMDVLTGSRQDSYLSWVSEESVQGNDLTLSIHRVIQHDAEEFLAEGVKEAFAESGSILVMDPQSGEILALSNYPNFDPRIERPTEAEAELRMHNRAVQWPVEPGSVMKMITVTMGIDSGKFKPEDIINCENGSFPRPKRKPIHDLHHYGALDVAHVLIKSSNIGVAKISIASGPRLLYSYLKRFGIGDKTGIELPAESGGILRHQECNGTGDRWCWSPDSHEYIAFGHEVGATTVQLGRAVCVIANGGLLVQPHLVMKRTRPTTDGRFENVPMEIAEPKRVLSAETSFTIRKIMQSVVVEGTGRRAAIPGYSSGGKTGSAEIFEHGAWQNKHNSSFIGFAPVTNPRIVVVVTLNRTPKQGGIAAAPVFSKIGQTALRVLQVPKDMPETDVHEKHELVPEVNELPQPKISQPAEPVKPAEPPKPFDSPYLAGPRVPDFRGKAVLAVVRESASRGLPVEIVGHGVARSQKPEPGTILPSGGRILVEFANAQ